MGLGVVGDLVGDARSQSKPASILQFRVEFPLKAEQHVPFRAPVVREVTRRIFNHAYADRTKVLSSPISHARFTRVFCQFDLCPVGNNKRKIRDLHSLRLPVPAVFSERMAARLDKRYPNEILWTKAKSFRLDSHFGADGIGNKALVVSRVMNRRYGCRIGLVTIPLYLRS